MRNPVIFVAEIGSMHKRDKSLAYEMMRQAKLSGATIAKFQFGHPQDDPVRYVDDWAGDIARWSEILDIEWMASIFSQDGLSAAKDAGVQRYKIPHQIALDPAQSGLVADVVATAKPVYISGKVGFVASNVHSIYVHDTYPCYEPHMPIGFQSSGWYGYSSHAHGIGDALLAVARGARYIEKHFCLSKPDLWVRDTTFALTPDEFSDMVVYGTEISRALSHRLS